MMEEMNTHSVIASKLIWLNILDTPDAEANAVFTVQPTQLTFISTKRPGELKCTAIGVGDIHMMCASQYLPGPSITKTGKTVDGKRQLTVRNWRLR